MTPNLLHRLRDVGGVVGSFACTRAGNPLVCDLPGSGEAEVRKAASNVVSLLELGRDSIRDCDRISCRFDGHLLEVLSLEFGFLCVVVRADHDRGLLAAAMRMVGRRFLGPQAAGQAPGAKETPHSRRSHPHDGTRGVIDA